MIWGRPATKWLPLIMLILFALPAAARADQATHVLAIKASDIPSMGGEGARCALRGWLITLRPTSPEISIIFSLGSTNDAAQASLSFHRVRVGDPPSSDTELAGRCGGVPIRRVRIFCPEQGSLSNSSACRDFTKVRVLAVPRIALRQIDGRGRHRQHSAGRRGAAGPPPPDCAGGAQARAAAQSRAATLDVVPSGLLGAALDRLAALGCPLHGHSTIAVVDFSRPSGVRRLWLIDLADPAAMPLALYVAHGRYSDPGNEGSADYFSNIDGSYMSSLGAFSVESRGHDPGHDAFLAMRGFDPSNDIARSRKIWVHTTPDLHGYVSPWFLARYGRLGRSRGCFVVMVRDFERVARALRGGGFLFAGRSADL